MQIEMDFLPQGCFIAISVHLLDLEANSKEIIWKCHSERIICVFALQTFQKLCRKGIPMITDDITNQSTMM